MGCDAGQRAAAVAVVDVAVVAVVDFAVVAAAVVAAGAGAADWCCRLFCLCVTTTEVVSRFDETRDLRPPRVVRSVISDVLFFSCVFFSP